MIMTRNVLLSENRYKFLEEFLLHNKIQKTKEFEEWRKVYNTIYGRRHTTIYLYAKAFVLSIISLLFIKKYLLKKKLASISLYSLLKDLGELNNQIQDQYNVSILKSINYFSPIFKICEINVPNELIEIFTEVNDFFDSINLNPEYQFDYIIHIIFSSKIRHRPGEFYTPPFLVQKMISEAYNFGERILDPCCGSGNFLIEVIKSILSTKKSEKEKFEAIESIYGFDINPISIFLTKLNLLYLLEDFSSQVNLNLIVKDFLFDSRKEFEESFDLVIGNPPWYPFRDIEDPDYQENVKILAEMLDIKPLPKNVLNIEISSLFFFKAKDYLKIDGKIFYVVTEGLLNGSHASRFRNFKGFKEVKVWKFSSNIIQIFNIDFICIFARKLDSDTIGENLKLPVVRFTTEKKITESNYFEPFNLQKESNNFYVPYYIEKKGTKTYTHKFVSQYDYNRLLPMGESYYKKLFHKGADLNPRNLIFITYKNKNSSLVTINPDMRIFKRAKAPWDKSVFRDETIEKQYLFKAIKSTELVKFYLYNHYDVFLPIDQETFRFNIGSLGERAKRFYNKINDYYMKNKKLTTKNESLMDNLDRWSKLCNSRQKSKIKVIYNNSGSIVNSAVVEGDFLVTGDLSFFATDDLDEAYYLSAILNSPLFTKQVQIKKSSRHIFKIPFEIPIEKYNSMNPNHVQLVELGKKGKEIAQTIVKELDIETTSKGKIQSFLKGPLKEIFEQIDKTISIELKS